MNELALNSKKIILTSCKDPLIDNDHFLLLLMLMDGLEIIT
jgi:hypothetical protein